MDVPIQSAKRKKIIRHTIYGVLLITFLAVTTYALSQLEPASPFVDPAQHLFDTVKRGDFSRKVRGHGSLVPEEIRWVPASTAGQVEEIVIHPGTWVKKDTVLVRLSNQELEHDEVEKLWSLKALKAEFNSLEKQLQNQKLTLETGLARMQADYAEANLHSKSESELAKDGLISTLQLEVSKVRAEELKKLIAMEENRMQVQDALAESQLAAQTARIEQASAMHELAKRRLESLQVKAAFEGVVEQVPVEVGQRVNPGDVLAKVTNPKKLKAVLRIEQNQAREIVIGQKATIDLRSSEISGTVARIDPAVVEGSVSIDVRLDEDLPNGARPDLSVTGTIEIENLVDVLYVGRPIMAQSDSIIGLFKVVENGKYADRVQVRLGRNSVNLVEVVQGLKEGDEIILSDMSRWDNVNRVQLR